MYYCGSVVTMLEDALTDHDLVHCPTASTIVKHLALGVVGLGCEDLMLHLMNLVWPNCFKTSPHVIGDAGDPWARGAVELSVAGAVPSCEEGMQGVLEGVVPWGAGFAGAVLSGFGCLSERGLVSAVENRLGTEGLVLALKLHPYFYVKAAEVQPPLNAKPFSSVTTCFGAIDAPALFLGFQVIHASALGRQHGGEASRGMVLASHAGGEQDAEAWARAATYQYIDNLNVTLLRKRPPTETEASDGARSDSTIDTHPRHSKMAMSLSEHNKISTGITFGKGNGDTHNFDELATPSHSIPPISSINGYSNNMDDGYSLHW
ncbi:hypothetical protein BDP27DRAFT_1372611 [Rhodocollybia butyracea]|uniref:Uncharacterized protein n=1 Tax=Rhodocollybia butyracea TaxID=206335 RepID=A0A9P5TXP0_9AGAR|nr:hypothetical protein BDP27DRAFT_1372611 [Rhodocollybia butyracea]